jgi:peptide/nickel transport system ATP-binding protein
MKVMVEELLRTEGLKVYYYTREGIVRAVDNINFSIRKRETVGIVGESGSGKSTLGLAILKLVPPPGRIINGRMFFQRIDLTKLNEKEMQKIRGKKISMVFQDPTTSLNPLMKIGEHLTETILTHEKVTLEEARERALKLLEDVGILRERFNDYPHQFSGGMRQRVGIALALALKPDLVIADEPTSSLDVIVQFQILELMKSLKKLYDMSLILITHDISIVSEIADKIALMYAGHLVEFAEVTTFFEEPLHPYAEALLHSVPNIQLSDQKLEYIPGMPPDLINPPKGCRFHPRCSYVKEICRKKEPPLIQAKPEHFVKCFNYVR